MKKAFYFMLIAVFVLEILTVWPDFLGIKKNGLIRKVKLISKFLKSQTGQQIIKI